MLLNKSVRGNCMCYNQKKNQVVISDLKMQINLRIFVSGCELLVSTKENSEKKLLWNFCILAPFTFNVMVLKRTFTSTQSHNWYNFTNNGMQYKKLDANGSFHWSVRYYWVSNLNIAFKYSIIFQHV